MFGLIVSVLTVALLLVCGEAALRVIGGKNIDGHARAVEEKAEELAPDFLIYTRQRRTAATARGLGRARAPSISVRSQASR